MGVLGVVLFFSFVVDYCFGVVEVFDWLVELVVELLLLLLKVGVVWSWFFVMCRIMCLGWFWLLEVLLVVMLVDLVVLDLAVFELVVVVLFVVVELVVVMLLLLLVLLFVV